MKDWYKICVYICCICKKKRQTVFKLKADEGICRKCKQPKIAPGQIGLLHEYE